MADSVGVGSPALGLGASVGAALGAAVGAVVGWAVGALVGLADWIAVGDGVGGCGLAVGMLVAEQPPPAMTVMTIKPSKRITVARYYQTVVNVQRRAA